MVTLALATLAGVGDSQRMSSLTRPRRGLPSRQWVTLLQSTRTGRYVDGSTYKVASTCKAPRPSACGTLAHQFGDVCEPVILMVSFPLTRACPAILNSPQDSAC